MTDPGRAPRLTIVTAAYNEEGSLPAYEKAVREVLIARTDLDVDVVLVDDGSTDRTWALMKEICAREPRFRAIRLSRNYGAHTAETAGLAHADGDAVVTLAGDLQDPPETVLELVAKWRAGARVVWGKRRTRADERWRILSSAVFASAIRRWAMPRGSFFTTGGFFLLDRKVLECFRQLPERHRINFALVAWTGFEQAVVESDRRERRAGRSTWSIRRLTEALTDAFIGFSSVPVRIITWAALAALGVSVVALVLALVAWLEGRHEAPWVGLAGVVAFFSAVQLFTLAVLGEYVFRIQGEVRRRPLYFVAEEMPAKGPS